MEQVFTVRKRKKPVLIDGKVRSRGEPYLEIFRWGSNGWRTVSKDCKTMKEVKAYIAEQTPANVVSKLVDAR